MIKGIHHICIETDRYLESINFYRSAMGFVVIDETKNFHGRDYNTWIKNGNVIIELQTPKNCVSVKNDSAGTGVIAHVCFLVDNLADTVNR